MILKNFFIVTLAFLFLLCSALSQDLLLAITKDDILERTRYDVDQWPIILKKVEISYHQEFESSSINYIVKGLELSLEISNAKFAVIRIGETFQTTISGVEFNGVGHISQESSIDNTISLEMPIQYSFEISMTFYLSSSKTSIHSASVVYRYEDIKVTHQNSDKESCLLSSDLYASSKCLIDKKASVFIINKIKKLLLNTKSPIYKLEDFALNQNLEIKKPYFSKDNYFLKMKYNTSSANITHHIKNTSIKGLSNSTILLVSLDYVENLIISDISAGNSYLQISSDSTKIHPSITKANYISHFLQVSNSTSEIIISIKLKELSDKLISSKDKLINGVFAVSIKVHEIIETVFTPLIKLHGFISLKLEFRFQGPSITLDVVESSLDNLFCDQTKKYQGCNSYAIENHINYILKHSKIELILTPPGFILPKICKWGEDKVISGFKYDEKYIQVLYEKK